MKAAPRNRQGNAAHPTAGKPASIDDYLAALGEEKGAVLEKLRRAIRAAAPRAAECISYGIPAFRLNGMLVGFGAAANHCAFYPMSSSAVEAHKHVLRDYDTSKATIRFAPDKLLPAALVRKLVRYRIAENARRRGGSKAQGGGARVVHGA
jgi:uncharacterized protein YdhG (YjbR/CyaY superfamily)